MISVTLILFLILAYFSYKVFLFIWSRYMISKGMKKLPGVFNIGLLGGLALFKNITDRGLTPAEAVAESFQIMNSLPEMKSTGIFQFWFGPIPTVLLYSPEAVEPILSGSSTITKASLYDFLHSWLGTGLLTSTGDKWRKNRKMLTPTFHFKILEDFLPIMNENITIFIELLEERIRNANPEENSREDDEKNDQVINGNSDKEKGSNGSVVINDISAPILLCALDIICETAMGKKINAQRNPNNDYVTAIHKIGEIFMTRIVKPWLQIEWIYNLTSTGREGNKYLKQLHAFTDTIIRARKKSIILEEEDEKMISSHLNQGFPNNNRTDDQLNENESQFGKTEDVTGRKRRMTFMDTLIYQHLTHPLEFTELNIREEVDTFMFEGHDTTAWGLIWATYLLGLHPEFQQKVHDELDSIFGDDHRRDFTFEDIKKLKYTECAVKEAQRLFPSVPLFARRLLEPITVLGHELPAGIDAIICPSLVHTRAEHWKDPIKFIPERFLETDQKRHPYAYIPFSAGPRNCIGQKFAILEEKTLLASLFRRFKVTSLIHRDKIKVVSALIIKSSNPIKVRLELRQ